MVLYTRICLHIRTIAYSSSFCNDAYVSNIRAHKIKLLMYIIPQSDVQYESKKDVFNVISTTIQYFATIVV